MQENTAIQTQTYAIGNFESVMKLAEVLKDFILKNKLSSKIQGRDFVNVEGWQFAGTALGIIPILESVNKITEGLKTNETKFEATVNLLNVNTGMVVGRGYALCSDTENGKKGFQEYAIASMAQTRAIGKAYRNILAYVVKAAGFEPTPSEEMQDDSEMCLPVEAIDKMIKGSKSRADMDMISETYPELSRANSLVKSYWEKMKKVVADEDSKLPITEDQKETLVKMLNNPVVTAAEKDKMLASMPQMNKHRASEAINNLLVTINQRKAAAVEV